MNGPNKIYDWVTQNVPEPKHEGMFYSYAYVCNSAYGYAPDKPGNFVREQLEEYIYDLCRNYDTGVQLGVQSHGQRGIRVFNLK